MPGRQSESEGLGPDPPQLLVEVEKGAMDGAGGLQAAVGSLPGCGPAKQEGLGPGPLCGGMDLGQDRFQECLQLLHDSSLDVSS